MKKVLFLCLILLLFSSCMSVSTGYFAKEPDFFIYPEQSILFTANIGDLQQNAQFEVKSDDSLNLFDGDKELFEKTAYNIFENLTQDNVYKSLEK